MVNPQRANSTARPLLIVVFALAATLGTWDVEWRSEPRSGARHDRVVPVSPEGRTQLGGVPEQGSVNAASPTLTRDHEVGRGPGRGAGPQPDTTAEPSIAADPEDPERAVAVFQKGRFGGGAAHSIGFATTSDGGRSWSTGRLPGLTSATGGEYRRVSDPVVAWGPGGAVYVASLLLTGPGGGSAVAVSASADGGRVWDPPRIVRRDEKPINDKEWIVVDNSGAPGHHLGRIYVTWNQSERVLASYSDDGGKSWHTGAVYSERGIGTIPLVMPDGDLAVVFATPASPLPSLPPGAPNEAELDRLTRGAKEVVAIAPGAGSVPTGTRLVFSPPATVGTYRGRDVRRVRAGEGLPTAAVDPGTGRIYVSWHDARYREDGANDVVLAFSDDGGVTWSQPRPVNAPGKGRVNNMTPVLAAAPGVVGMSYRTRREDPGAPGLSPFVHTLYRQSSDGGRTFSPPLRINRRRTDLRFAAVSHGRPASSAFLGDYSGLALSGGLVYVARCEARPVSPRETATWRSRVTHQRTWVAVLEQTPPALVAR